jgi:hypothetical protein
MEWSKQQYSKKKEIWVPWLEDIYLRWFTRDNKASYTTKGTSKILVLGSLHFFLPFFPTQQENNKTNKRGKGREGKEK